MRICRGLRKPRLMPRMLIGDGRTSGMRRGNASRVARLVAGVRSGRQPRIRPPMLRMGTQIASAAPRVT
jgi:hypothetical protein